MGSYVKCFTDADLVAKECLILLTVLGSTERVKGDSAYPVVINDILCILLVSAGTHLNAGFTGFGLCGDLPYCFSHFLTISELCCTFSTPAPESSSSFEGSESIPSFACEFRFKLESTTFLDELACRALLVLLVFT